MMKRAVARQATCLVCQWRAFSISYMRLATPAPQQKAQTPNPTPAPTPQPTTVVPQLPEVPAAPDVDEALARAPKSYGKKLEQFTPIPLSRPIGLNYPPSPGQNTGIDPRTLKQRRDDFVDYSKHLERRKELKHKMSKPYFRDWSNMAFHRGKSFIAPPRPFKADVSLYFPNFFGRTLLKDDKKGKDTTPRLQGKVSVVTIFSNLWAENQTKTFVGHTSNPDLQRILAENKGTAQLVRVNVEDSWMKATLITLFMGRLRKMYGKDDWDKYFLVRRPVSDEIKEHMGLLNSKVGYVYLVDKECRIRWAGSADAEGDEREGLVKAVQRVLAEMGKSISKSPLPSDDKPAAEPAAEPKS